MKKSDIVNKMKEGSVSLTFLKANGELRDMTATLNDFTVKYPDVASTSRAQKLSDTTQAVWDETVNGWRSFRWESVRAVDGIDTPSGIKS